MASGSSFVTMTTAPADFVLARHRALGRILEQEQVDALLVSHPPNIAYLTGFFGSAGVLIFTGDSATLVSDSRYGEDLSRVRAQLPGLRTLVALPESSQDESVAAELASLSPRRLGIEDSAMTVRQHLDLTRRLAAAGCRSELVPLESAVEQVREVKDAWEVGTLREAGRRLSDVAKCIIPKVLAGSAERQLAALIEWELRSKGFDKPAFDTIVAAGPNAAVPHHRAGDRQLAEGDLVVVDFGGMFRGYAVDLTRTVILGRSSARQDACWTAVARAQRAAFAAATVGTEAEAVDAAARRVLEREEMGEAFGHGLGHGLGLEVHERPRLSRRRAGVSQGSLRAGMVFTLEPGVYFPGWGGVRIEDDVLSTEAGPEWLTEPVDGVRAT
jgi:Xaa-Pro aminopeptidase